jgi:hypothetical protein
MKNHPLFQAQVGAVFAVRIGHARWGFVRFFRGGAMAAHPIFADTPALPNIDWHKAPVGWVFFSLAPKNDPTEAVFLGTVPYESEADEWPPPCYDPPDIIQNYYRIHERGRFREYATARDVEGMKQCRTVTPTMLAQFLKEQDK